MATLGGTWRGVLAIAACLALSACSTEASSQKEPTPDGASSHDSGVDTGTDGTVDAPDSPDAPECTPEDLAACPEPTTFCAGPACIGGKCTTEPKAEGVALPSSDQVSGDCSTLVCDGKGGTASQPADDPPSTSQECQTIGCAGGGPVTSNKPDGQACSAGICAAGNCVPPFCGNGTKDQQETDVDCGGGQCNDCGDGAKCLVAGDCTSGVCENGVCAAPTCVDQVKNGSETSVDCGGSCAPCGTGATCAGPSDCQSGVCTQKACVAASCTDGVANGDESAVDCGGSCTQCADGKKCKVAGDCVSVVCTSGACAAATCSDGVKNGSESAVDCGGACALKCANGTSCASSADCASGWCKAGACAAPSCSDGVKNGAEADVDCGGSCSPCGFGKACTTTADCSKGQCFHGACAYANFELDAPRTHYVKQDSSRLRAADFDQDGDVDALIFGGGYPIEGVSLSLNDGKGSFGVATTVYADTIYDVEVADFNGDGFPDAVAAVKDKLVNGSYGALVVFTNSKTGALVPGAVTALPIGRLTVGDVDGDGDPDVVAASSGGCALFRNVGGQLAAPTTIPGGDVDVVLADLDADSDLDLAALSSAGSGMLRVSMNDGSGTFGPAAPSPPSFSLLGGAHYLVAGDLSSDGKQDLVYGSNMNTQVLLNDGTGAFPTQKHLSYSSGKGPPRLFDVDRNGTLDLLFAGNGELDAHDYVRVFTNPGNGLLVDAGGFHTGQHLSELALADFDGDCRYDILSPYLAHLTLLSSRGNGSYPNPKFVEGLGEALAIADLNGDAKPDVVDVGSFSSLESLISLTVNSGGTLAPGPTKAVASMTDGVTTGDFDGDGDVDVATSHHLAHKVRVWLNDGKGNLAGPTEYATDSVPRDLVASDFDGDGKQDLMVACEGPVALAYGHIDFFKGKGDGTFAPKVDAYAKLVNPSRLVVVDWTQSGQPGLAVLSETQGTAYRLLNTGAAKLGGELLLITGPSAQRITAADFDGDGSADVAVTFAPASGSAVGVVTSKGGYQAQYYPTDWQSLGVAAGDLNGDGRPDLAVTNLGSDSLSVLLNTGSAFEAARHYALGYDPLAVAIVDFDADGRADVIGGGTITLVKNRSGEASVACAVCGDGVVADPEVCDDGGKVGSDGCSATCGVELGYACSGAPSTCAPKCGDALIVGGEGCDDANTAPGDGCSASCKVVAGWKCSGKPSVCQPICGDSSVVGSELCDDGNQLDGDSCPSSCRHDLWSFAFGNPGQQDFAEGVAFSPQGDVLVVATVNGPVTVGSTPLPAMGSNDALLAKLGAQGNLAWAKRFGGSGDDRAQGVASDSSGNVLMSGAFSGSIDFGGGPLVSAGSWDVFLTKLSATGQHVFSKRFGDASQQDARTLAVAPNGDIVIAGSFTGTLDFGGGPLVSTGGNDIYVAALSSAGSHLFSKRFGSAGSDSVAALAVGPSGDIYAGGVFDGTIDFGTGLHTSAGAGDIFLVKISATGSTAWSRSYGLNNNWESVRGIAADAAGVTLAGTFWGSQSFGGPAVVSKGDTDIFVAKLDPSGNHLWSRSFGGTGTDTCSGLAVNPDGSTAVVVRFNTPIDVGGTVFAPSPDSWLVSRLTSAGAIAWAQAYGAASPTVARGSASGRFAVVGTFSTALDFGGTPLSGGAFDVFVVTFAP